MHATSRNILSMSQKSLNPEAPLPERCKKEAADSCKRTGSLCLMDFYPRANWAVAISRISFVILA
jgi:hypothetical protein